MPIYKDVFWHEISLVKGNYMYEIRPFGLFAAHQ